MKIAIAELTEKIENLLKSKGFNDQDSKTLAGIVVEQELIGNQFSAVGEISHKYAELSDESISAKSEIASEKTSAKLIKGNGRIAPLITADYLDEIANKAKEQGIYAFGIYDSTYNDFFEVFCRRLADQNLVSIIAENGGPQGVTPFGGRSDVTGTNPLAYGIPTNKYPIIFDAATAMHAYGRIKQAKEKNESLPDNAYVDKDGNITTDPNQAIAVLPFGGFKGFAVNLLVDVLSGSLVKGKSGLDQPLDSQRYIGTFIIVIDPSAFGDLNEFKASTTKLVEDIEKVAPVDPAYPVRVPGQRGSKRMEEFKTSGMIEIADADWAKFESAL